MKKKLLFFTTLLLINIFTVKNTYAYSASDYVNRTLCGKFEVSLFKSDGSIEAKSCHDTFDQAKEAMIADGGVDLALLTRFGNETKILDANAALVDFTHPSTTFDIYDSHEINNDHTYMYGASGYGAVDGALLDSGYSSSATTFTLKIKVGGYTGWVRSGNVEIVPLVWVKSSSSYTISNESIRHNFVTKIQNTYTGNSGTTIGPKPEMLSPGTYYSYDGHYFYTNRYTMIADYKAGNYNNSVNKDKPYYNYYQFLPQHTRTTYSSINIDEYVRNVMGYGRNVYGTKASSNQGINTSRLYGQGAFFYSAQELYGANALLAFGVSRNESGNGKSNLSINKNNGFGLNAVDSNPTQAADYFATFSQSILDYANVWVNYGYSEPTDWRYNGSQNGNKFVGMNVRYASDVYWGEKMASNYYTLDKAFGFQDYNFYQTAVTTQATDAKSAPSTSSKSIFRYKSADNGLVIIDEVEGQEINGNKTWYKVVSDMNIDSNFNQITSGYYNWDSYVYIPAAHVLKTNKGKNGYISPNEVTEYQDKNYTYDLHTVGGSLQPKVALTVKDTSYYYDPTLISKTGQTLLNERYVMVFATAYDKDKNVVSYLVTSDYKYDQKHWINADSIKFVTSRYGQASVTVSGMNAYTIVNPTTVDDLSTHISGLYHYAYTPILEEKTVDGNLWYKVPVNLSGTTNVYGWTLASAPDVLIRPYEYKASNTPPVINAKDLTIVQGQEFKELEGITATDTEDGNITKNITVISNQVKTDTPGTYEVTYQVKDNENVSVTKTIKVTVVKDEEPVINATDKKISIGKDFDELSGITATDKEDGNITENIKVINNTVKKDELGIYEVTYQVTDSYNHTVTKTIKVSVEEITLIEKSGRFDLEYLKDKDNELIIKGYSTIDGIDNNLKVPIEYKLVFEKINNSEEMYELPLNRITDSKDITYTTPSTDGKDYKYSWFEGTIDITKIPIGDYVMYIQASSDEYFSKNIVNNQMFGEQLVDMKQGEKYLMTRNNYFSKNKPVEILIRNEKIGEKTVSAISNQYGQLEDLKFTDNNKLYIYGNAFSYTANLGVSANVTRKIIFENLETFESKSYDLGSITNGNYVVKMPVDDKQGKERAWYKKELDISDLPKGKYSIYIQTISNVSDIGELNEQLFRDLSEITKTINNKKYTFDVNYDQRYRVELTVE